MYNIINNIYDYADKASPARVSMCSIRRIAPRHNEALQRADRILSRILHPRELGDPHRVVRCSFTVVRVDAAQRLARLDNRARANEAGERLEPVRWAPSARAALINH